MSLIAHVEAERRGLDFWNAKCPYHEHPSTTVKPLLLFRKMPDRFHCTYCGAHGRVVSSRMHVEGDPFTSDPVWVADIVREEK